MLFSVLKLRIYACFPFMLTVIASVQISAEFSRSSSMAWHSWLQRSLKDLQK